MSSMLKCRSAGESDKARLEWVTVVKVILSILHSPLPVAGSGFKTEGAGVNVQFLKLMDLRPSFTLKKTLNLGKKKGVHAPHRSSAPGCGWRVGLKLEGRVPMSCVEFTKWRRCMSLSLK